jgi:hypothetical protein
MLVYIVWSPATGPIAVYVSPTNAAIHARSMSGVDVAIMPVREQLSPVVLDDLEVDFDDVETPPVEMIETDPED